MKTFVKNLKPFIAYWACVAVYMLVAFFGDIYDAWWPAVMAAVLCILNGLTGYTDGVKEIRWGIALFGVQLGAGAALCFISADVFAFANILFINQPFYNSSTAAEVVWAVGSVAVGLLPFFIGAAVRQKVPQSPGKRVRMPWQDIYCNAKPFFAYWGCLAVYILVPLLTHVSRDTWAPFEKAWAICCVAAICVLNFVTGCTDGIYKIRWGLTVFTMQMGICAGLTVAAENNGLWALRNAAAIGNAVPAALFGQPESWGQSALFVVLGVVLPLVPFFIGWGIRRSVQKKKGSGQNYRTSTTGAHV